jgi:myosin heavy subunit
MSELESLQIAYKGLAKSLDIERQSLSESRSKCVALIQEISALRIKEKMFGDLQAETQHLHEELDKLKTAHERLCAEAETLRRQNGEQKLHLDHKGQEIERLRKQLEYFQHIKDKDTTQWVEENSRIQAEANELRERLERFQAAEKSFRRMTSLCTHIQEALKVAIISGWNTLSILASSPTSW